MGTRFCRHVWPFSTEYVRFAEDYLPIQFDSVHMRFVMSIESEIYVGIDQSVQNSCSDPFSLKYLNLKINICRAFIDKFVIDLLR